MKRTFLIGILLLIFVSCQKKPAFISVELPPEEPLQRLAWDTVQQINSRITNASVKIGDIQNQASLPDSSFHYFRGALENEIRKSKVPDAPPVTVNGILTYAEGQLQFLWKTKDYSQGEISGMSAILWSQIPKETPKVPEEHDHAAMPHHREVSIPAPVAYLQSPPLDVNQVCPEKQEECEIIVLYDDAVERIQWKTGNKTKVSIAPEHLLQIRSRAPSGKILALSEEFLVLNNNLSNPLKYDSHFGGLSVANLPAYIPKPEPGLNTFLLMNGRFYDFELLNPKGIAVVQQNQMLSIGAGTLITANELVGSSLAVAWPAIYTSSASLPGQPDSVLKFIQQDSTLSLVSNQEVPGEILDLAITDLNQDGTSELLVTVRTKDQIYIDVLELF
jgi:hypothetical protein